MCLAVLLSAAVTTTGWSGDWSQNSRLQEGRVLIEAVADGTDIYVAGGSTVAGPRASFDLYDTIGDIWRPLPPMPLERERFGMAGASGRIYVSGGRTREPGDKTPEVSSDLSVYDTISRQWLHMTDMPGIRVDHEMVQVGDFLYVLGGTGKNAGKIYIYDIVKDTWTVSDTVMAEPRKGFGIAVNESRIYLVGGVTLTGQISKAVSILDTGSMRWSTGRSIPNARVGLTASFVDSRLHIAGGSIPDPAMTFNEHYSWAPGETTWQEEEILPTARHSMASALVGDAWYVIGGGAAAGFYTLFAAADAVEAFRP